MKLLSGKSETNLFSSLFSFLMKLISFRLSEKKRYDYITGNVGNFTFCDGLGRPMGPIKIFFSNHQIIGCTDCMDAPFLFKDGLRGVFYLLKLVFPSAYCFIFDSTWLYTSWLVEIPWLSERFTFPGSSCSDRSIILTKDWVRCFGFNAVTTLVVIVLLIIALFVVGIIFHS